MDSARQYYQLAGRLQSDSCFPFQLESAGVLTRAMEVNPGDARAALYLGNLLAAVRAGRETRPDPMMLAMNAAGYDAMVLGNHEFHFGLPNLLSARKSARSSAAQQESQRLSR